MKATTAIIAFTLFAVATAAAESSAGKLANHWTTLPKFLVDYYWQPMDFLVVFLWKWIMYGVFYVAMDQIYCNFFANSLDTILATVIAGASLPIAFPFNASADPATAKKNCKEAFWNWYNTLNYWGTYNDRGFYF